MGVPPLEAARVALDRGRKEGPPRDTPSPPSSGVHRSAVEREDTTLSTYQLGLLGQLTSPLWKSGFGL